MDLADIITASDDQMPEIDVLLQAAAREILRQRHLLAKVSAERDELRAKLLRKVTHE